MNNKYDFMENNDLNENEKEFIYNAKHGNLNKLKLSDINIHIDGEEALILSAENNHLNVVKYLVDCGADTLNWMPIVRATINNHFKIVEYLISKPHSEFAINIALLWTAEKGYLKIMKLLLKNNADINYNNSEPLCISIKYNQVKITDYLIKNGGNKYINKKI